MKRNVFVLLSAASILLPGCKQKQQAAPQPQLQATKDLKPAEFIPPEDSTISVEKMKAWISCNPLLDSLTVMYADSFKTEDPAHRMRYQSVFSAAQDKICVLAGLRGGYKEYKWILQNMGTERNKAVLDSVHAAAY